MSLLLDGDSSSSDLCNEDRNASQQRSKLVEGQSFRTGARSTHVERRAYNLRPRKDDPVAIQRRSEFARLRREQQNQRRNKRKKADTFCREQEIRDYEEFIHNKLRFEELPKKSDKDLEYRIEVITGGINAKWGREWRRYFEASDTGLFKTTLKGANWEVERLALQASASVVGLQSFTGDAYLFSCSGTIVEFFEESNMIVTVANLVKKPDAVEVANNLKISVYLPQPQDHKTLEGHLSYHDFHHNICVIQVQSPFHLPEKRFSSNVEAINFDKICSRDVVTLGRGKDNHALLVTTGKIIPKSSKFDCNELLVSTCTISRVEVGGPLMDFDGNFIGMNYYHAKETPFVPSFIVLKCLQQFKLFGAVIRPWLGLRVRTLHAEGSMQTNFHGATGVVIEKMEEDSYAKESGLNEGDIINQVNGVYISNTAELGGVLLDITTKALLEHRIDLTDVHNVEICVKFGLRSCET